MKPMLAAFVIASTWLPVTSGEVRAQGAGVCNRQADEVAEKVRSDSQSWINAIDPSLPEDEKAAYRLVFSRNRDRTLVVVDAQKQQCTAKYKPLQDKMDAVVAYYTGGLSLILAPQMTHVDVSEILKGYPLGGPNALVPKFREQILHGDKSTVANIIRDPWKCLSFQRKC